MKKFLIILLVIFLLVTGGVAFLFYKSFDEENFKEQIILSTKALTGCDVAVAGDMKVKLFPSPVITLTDVVVRNNIGKDSDDLMRIKSVEAHIRFASLFKNPLIVDNIIVNDAEVFLRRNEKGENNWNFTFLRADPNAGNKDNMLGESFLDKPPQFQNIELKNATLTYLNALTGKQFQLTDINGKVTSSSITGPFDFSGSLKKDAIPLNASLYISKLNVASQTNFTLSLTNPTSKAIFSIQDGKMEKLGGLGQTFLGSFTVNIPRLSAFLLETKGYKDLPEPLNKAVLGNGKFNITDKSFALNEVAVHYGNDEKTDILENALVADVNIIYPIRPKEKTKISTQIRSSRLNIDTFLPYIPKQDSWADGLALVTPFLPNDIDIVLSSTQVVLAEQTIKDFTFSATVSDKEMTVREMKAVIPEDTALKAIGYVDMGENPVVKLEYSMQTKSIAKLLDWLKVKNSAVQIDKVGDLSVSGVLQLRPQDITLANMDLTSEGGSVKGGMVFALTEPELTGYVNLNLNKINIDNFIPYEAPTEEKTFTEWLQELKADLEKSPLLSDVNMSFTLTGQDVTFKSLPMDQFSYEGKIENKTWKTDSLKVSQMAMSNIDYKGTIQKLPDNSLVFKDVQLNLEMPKSLLLLSRLKIKSPLVNNNNKVNLRANLSGSFEKMALASDVSFTQGRIYFQGNVEKILMSNPNYTMSVKISHPNFQQFMNLFGVKFDHFPSLNGNFAFEGNIKGIPGELAFTNSNLTIGSQKLQGDLTIQTTENGSNIQGNIQTPYLYFDKFISSKNIVSGTNAKTGKTQFSNNLFDFSGLEDLSMDLQLSAEKAGLGKIELSLLNSRIGLSQKMLLIDSATAMLGGGKIDLTAALNYSTATPFIKGSLKMDKVPVRPDLITLGMFRLKSGLFSLMWDFNTRGNSFDDMIHELSGSGRFAVQDGIISSLNLNAFERRVRANLSRKESFDSLKNQLNREVTIGETAFDSLEGSFAITNGIFRTSDTVMRTPDANAMIQTNFDIPAWSVNSSFAISFKNFTGYPPISIMVKGATHNPQTNIDFTSFIKHLESTSADLQRRLEDKEKEKELNKTMQEARERIRSLTKMVADAGEQIEKAEQILQLASTPMAKTELVRAKDAFVILQELANKQAPTVADTDKASIQANLIKTRTDTVIKSVTQKAIEAVRKEIAEVQKTAQQKMDAINKIHQRLYNVEQIEEAHKKAFSAMNYIQQAVEFANQSTDLGKLNKASEQVQLALKAIEKQYNNLAKFDIDGDIQTPEQDNEPAQIQGSIRRAS